MQARANEDCLDSAKQMAGAMAVAGVPVGFFKAHVTLKVRCFEPDSRRSRNISSGPTGSSSSSRS